jgi:hypothetical protein
MNDTKECFKNINNAGLDSRVEPTKAILLLHLLGFINTLYIPNLWEGSVKGLINQWKHTLWTGLSVNNPLMKSQFDDVLFFLEDIKSESNKGWQSDSSHIVDAIMRELYLADY